MFRPSTWLRFRFKCSRDPCSWISCRYGRVLSSFDRIPTWTNPGGRSLLSSEPSSKMGTNRAGQVRPESLKIAADPKTLHASKDQLSASNFEISSGSHRSPLRLDLAEAPDSEDLVSCFATPILKLDTCRPRRAMLIRLLM